MKFNFGYTGLRVRNLNEAVEFFTKMMGMKVQARIPAPWNKGEFVNLVTGDGKHWLELNWYADDSPVAGPFKEGEELDHLGFEVDDLQAALERLKQGGYPTLIGPTKAGNWDFAFVKGIERIWLDVYHITRPGKKKSQPAKKKRSR